MGAKDSKEPAVPAVSLEAQQVRQVELILAGAFAPLRGFLNGAEIKKVAAENRLLSGECWSMPIELIVDRERAAAAQLMLRDGEGRPIALLTITDRESIPEGVRVSGNLSAIQGAAAKLQHFAGVCYAYQDCLHQAEIEALNHTVAQGEPLLLIRTTRFVDGPDLRLHQTRIADGLAGRHLRAAIERIEIPHWHCEQRVSQYASWQRIAANLGARALLVPQDVAVDATNVDGSPLPLLPLSLTQQALIAGDHDAVTRHLLAGRAAQAEMLSPHEVVDALRVGYPPPDKQGFTLLFTGLSGAGKSTIARALAEALMQRSKRPVSLLDGDLIRLHLSKGLGFDRAGRETNLARIAFVAGEINRHGGIAICAPIAPYASTRQKMRNMIEASGRFIEIHVATPIEVCEQRDPKGLYADARAGRIGNFTGIGDDYEIPVSPDLRLDTSRLAINASVETVLDFLSAERLIAASAS